MTEAAEAIRLQPAWHKGYLRKSHALICLQQYTEASEVIEQGLHRARSTASLLEAKEALQDLPSRLKHSKKPRQQPASSIQAVLGKLQAAGALVPVSLNFVKTQYCSVRHDFRHDFTLDEGRVKLTLQVLTQRYQSQS